MEASLLDQILEKVASLEGLKAYLIIFGVLFGCGLGIPIPEDVTIVTAGYLAYLENIDLGWAMVVCLLGVLSGDLLLFSLGRIFGKKFFQHSLVRFLVTPEQVAYAQAKLKKNARKIIFSARFLAGLRAPIFLSAGMLGVKSTTFVYLDFLGAIISVPTLTFLGYYFGDEIDIGLGYIRRAEHYIMIGLAFIGLLVLFNVIRKRMRAPDKLGDN